MAKYMLVSFKTCPWVQRSAIILREKNTPFEMRHIEPDNRPDWFLAMSPHKKVPVLRIDDSQSLFESNAINEFLDETIAPRLHPEDPIKRAAVLRAVADDADLRVVELNRAFVLMQYFGYLRRNADDPQDSDFVGWKFWLDKLNHFNGNFIQAEMVKAFITSIEYRQRFGP